MIFDEIDRGVGGAVASAIGERLARLAETLAGARRDALAAGRGARLAPLPDREEPRRRRHPHHVRKLGDEERREEIARMLSGASVTEEARAQASRLLDAA